MNKILTTYEIIMCRILMFLSRILYSMNGTLVIKYHL